MRSERRLRPKGVNSEAQRRSLKTMTRHARETIRVCRDIGGFLWGDCLAQTSGFLGLSGPLVGCRTNGVENSRQG